MVFVPMNASDAKAIRHLLTATQRSVAPPRSETPRANANNAPYRYRFDEFDDYDDDSDDERDFRDLSHYCSIDPKTGRVTELWLGIIGSQNANHPQHTTAQGAAAAGNYYWTLSEADWQWLARLDQLRHLKVTRCGALPYRQLKELAHLEHISCSECGTNLDPLGAGDTDEDGGDGYDDDDEGETIADDDTPPCRSRWNPPQTDSHQNTGIDLPNIKSLSLRCAFQPTAQGIRSLGSVFDWIKHHLPGLERLTIWRLDQPPNRWSPTPLSAYQRTTNKRLMVEALLDGLSLLSPGATKDADACTKSNAWSNRVTTLELNRCGLTSSDFRRLVLDILPGSFPFLQRLSLASNDIDELPQLKHPNACPNYHQEPERNCFHKYEYECETECDDPTFSRTKQKLCRLRRSLQQIHLSNNPIMEFLGKHGDEDPLPLSQEQMEGTSWSFPEERTPGRESGTQPRKHTLEQRRKRLLHRLLESVDENHTTATEPSLPAVLERRVRRLVELEHLRDLLELFPRLSHLGYASCVHKLLRSVVGDVVVDHNNDGNNNDETENRWCVLLPFGLYAMDLQRQIEFYLRFNRGGRRLVEGIGCEPRAQRNEERRDDGDDDDKNHGNAGGRLLEFLALWPNILEWSYRTSSGGCFLMPLPPLSSSSSSHAGSAAQASQHAVSTPTHHSAAFSNKNATALYRLLREGPVLFGSSERQ